ncbi:secreted phosphoprotein 24-like isoform X1 [Megalops cyprinoides]|uniref:secreted phosphoprotein 24-like isoform X1 n=1 Tax=Megalops cyprinoides TaxID=118141 RepID=UPI001864804D|nr:secreted phosphoprotein 24-like isoform X1 [Megalops cyprinoides]
MNRALLLLVLLQPLCCSGFTRFPSNITPMAERALNVSLERVNNQSSGPRLYGVTRGAIKGVTPVGVKTYGLTLNFSIRETVCMKGVAIAPSRCAFRRGFATSQASCSSRVLVSDQLTQIMSLRCSRTDDSSSSSESSSEEMLWRGLLMNR